MRLLSLSPNERDFQLTEFFDSSIPPYAILSHTWGPIGEEVKFQMLQSAASVRTRSQPHSSLGWKKLKFCSQQAKRDGLSYFWIDTCCINKESSAELSEAINSMFAWYRDAAVCYVYLSDVSSVDKSSVRFSQQLNASKWFTRGWTLQEYIAPRDVQFFSKEGIHLMDRLESTRLLPEKTTGIPVYALLGMPLELFPVRDRLKWIGVRQTTRQEDMTYCLQGLVDIYMPIIYGEKHRATDRLLEAVDKLNQREKGPDWTSLTNQKKKAYPLYWELRGLYEESLSSPTKALSPRRCWELLKQGAYKNDLSATLELLTYFILDKHARATERLSAYMMYKAILATGVNPNICRTPQKSLLWRACAHNNPKLMRMLLDHDATKPRGIIKMYVEKWGFASNPSGKDVMRLLLDRYSDQMPRTCPVLAYQLEPEDYSYSIPARILQLLDPPKEVSGEAARILQLFDPPKEVPGEAARILQLFNPPKEVSGEDTDMDI